MRNKRTQLFVVFALIRVQRFLFFFDFVPAQSTRGTLPFIGFFALFVVLFVGHDGEQKPVGIIQKEFFYKRLKIGFSVGERNTAFKALESGPCFKRRKRIGSVKPAAERAPHKNE